MSTRDNAFAQLGVVTLVSVTVLGSHPKALAQAKDPSKPVVKAAGILFDRKDNSIFVKADGEEGPVKYSIDPANQTLVEVMKFIFPASRVQLTYTADGDSRHLVSIKRQILKASGTVTGVVVQVHNDFWIELKPRNGPANAFAPTPENYNDKAFMERLKALKPGDSVTIVFTTDFERHRILKMRKNGGGGPAADGNSGRPKPR